jgi:hypothetical protein
MLFWADQAMPRKERPVIEKHYRDLIFINLECINLSGNNFAEDTG